MSDKPSRAVLRWHGGKWVLAPWIIQHLPPHRTYTEAFGGAGSVLLRKPRSYAEVWNDLDGHVVNLFRVLRDRKRSAALRRALFLTPFSRTEFDLSYEPADDPVELARRLVIRSFMGFGSNAHNRKAKSGFRSNSNRSGTTPAHDWANYPRALAVAIRRLRGVVIEKKDACELLEQHDGSETLHYVDPPYVHATRTGGSSTANRRYQHELSDDDHKILAGVLRGLQGMVVLSGYRSELYQKLYPEWVTFERKAMADGARERLEILWLNKAAASRLAEKNQELWPKTSSWIPTKQVAT